MSTTWDGNETKLPDYWLWDLSKNISNYCTSKVVWEKTNQNTYERIYGYAHSHLMLLLPYGRGDRKGQVVRFNIFHNLTHLLHHVHGVQPIVQSILCVYMCIYGDRKYQFHLYTMTKILNMSWLLKSIKVQTILLQVCMSFPLS